MMKKLQNWRDKALIKLSMTLDEKNSLLPLHPFMCQLGCNKITSLFGEREEEECTIKCCIPNEHMLR